jgi:alpha-tubulin suppressor-like RCC1 family protein
MKIRFRPLLLSFGVATGSMATIVACSSSDERPTFEEPEADSGPPSLSPDAAAPYDAGSPLDAADADTKAPFDPTDETVTCAADAPCAVQLVAGENHFCARMSDGTARCWGDNAKGSLGTTDAGTAPADAGIGDAGDGGLVPGTGFVVSAVDGLEDATQLSAGGTTTCALVADGGVQCWGGNDRGQLGLQVSPPLSDSQAHPAVTPTALTSPARRIDVGARSACSVLTNGEVWCWGDNTELQLARKEPRGVAGPAKAELDGLAIARTAASTNNGFAVSEAGELSSWGAVSGTKGLLSARTSSMTNDALPVAIGLSPVTSFAVSAGSTAHACAVVNGALYCWGNSTLGALGTGLADKALSPVRSYVGSETAWPQQVAAAGELTCVRLTDGTVQCTGDNSRGALGRITTQAFSWSFKPSEELTGHAVAVAVSKTTVCALVKDGGVVCWGGNERGELGQGVTDKTPHPTPVSIRF